MRCRPSGLESGGADAIHNASKSFLPPNCAYWISVVKVIILFKFLLLLGLSHPWAVRDTKDTVKLYFQNVFRCARMDYILQFLHFFVRRLTVLFVSVSEMSPDPHDII